MKNKWQKLPSRGALRKRCSENIQVCRRTPMQKLNFNRVASNFIETTLRHGSSPVNVRHISRTHFLKNTSGRLFLKWIPIKGDKTSIFIH